MTGDVLGVLAIAAALVMVGPWLIAGGPGLWVLVVGITPLVLLAISAALDALERRRRRRNGDP